MKRISRPVSIAPNTPAQEQIIWRKKGSNLKGYDLTIFTQKNKNLYRVDYSMPAQKVRILFENFKGRRFWSEIEKGKILRSNCMLKAVNQNQGITDPITEEREIFEKLPDKEVFFLFGGNHGLGKEFQGVRLQAGREMEKGSINQTLGSNGMPQGLTISALDNKFKDEMRKRYFGGAVSSAPEIVPERSLPGRKIFGFLDVKFLRNTMETIIVLLLASFSLYHQWLSPISTGALTATSGILLGGVDLVGRKEEPCLSKVLILVLTGGFLYFKYFFSY
jgi:hypothetical protein